jgi:anti-sigma factor ChrR (cupin superfamily)
MMVNADFKKRAAVHAAQLPWTPSPIAGIERRMLDRVGDEVARATSIVRYAAQSSFSRHTHGGGEEFLVLDGVFQDEHSDYPAGFYVRNPPGSAHTPRSETGCVIFVKLWQFEPSDRKQVRLDTGNLPFQPSAGRLGVSSALLFRDEHEEVRLERWLPNTQITLEFPAGGEVLVLDGSFEDGEQRFEHLSWLRLPAGDSLRAATGLSGCKVWTKSGSEAVVCGNGDRR